MRTTINLPPAALALAKEKASQAGVSLGEVVGEAILSTFAERPRRGKARRQPMPVSRAKSTVLPGIDLDDRSTYDQHLGVRL